MLDENTLSYIKKLEVKRNVFYHSMEQKAVEEHIPIISVEVGSFIDFICRIHKPQYILEIGTAIGYSTMWLHDSSDAKIDTIELDPERHKFAKDFFEKNIKSARVNFILADALVALKDFKNNNYDLIFLDAAKGQYINFFNLIEPLSQKGTIVVTDNIFMAGKVTGASEITKRQRSMVKKVDEYNHMLANKKDWTTYFLTIGDGLAVSIKN